MLEEKIGWHFDNTYSELSNYMLSKLKPVPVKKPKLLIFNYHLSKDIGLDFSGIKEEVMANIFSGNQLPKGAETIAQAYAGHQFGHFTILGDGRALIVGEHLTKKRERYDIQFKGSGKTPYSRNADGRAAVGPMLREYLVSEAMYHLNIKTTRSLTVVETGEKIQRETDLKGAILTRVASSHIRVGTFQYALISKDKNDLKNLFDYTINRHFPYLKSSKNKATELLKTVQEKQVDLICNWMRVGFIHGVMNTDNMTVSGETIDYGPCAFMDHYDPHTVFSSIDLNGRYAYYNQPKIALWNLERFAECLIPLIHEDKKKSVKLATEILKEFPSLYRSKWLKMMRNKLGLFQEHKNDEILIFELLDWMKKNKADYTNTFCFLMNEHYGDNKIYNHNDFILWKKKWEKRQKINKVNLDKSLRLMRKANPLIIPRNHLVEKSLNQAEEGNLEKFTELNEVLKKPYNKTPSILDFQATPNLNDKKYVTFCGT